MILSLCLCTTIRNLQTNYISIYLTTIYLPIVLTILYLFICLPISLQIYLSFLLSVYPYLCINKQHQCSFHSTLFVVQIKIEGISPFHFCNSIILEYRGENNPITLIWAAAEKILKDRSNPINNSIKKLKIFSKT